MTGPLGIYDSGIGGETVVAEIKKIFPHISICYLKHTSLFPFGNKTKQQIDTGMEQAATLLFQKGCPLIIVACNSASIASIRYLQQTFISTQHPDKNILGINIPILELLDEKHVLKPKKGLVLSTTFTAQSGFYNDRLTQLGFKHIDTLALPGLADAIEEHDEKKIKQALESSLRHTQKDSVDFVLLACTHYPLAIETIRSYFNPTTLIIDPSQWIAQKFEGYLQKHHEYQIDQDNKYEIIEA